MKKCTRLFLSAAAAALMLLAIPSGAMAVAEKAVPGLAPDGATNGFYTDENGDMLVGCTPETGVGNPHRSSTGIAASGHGWCLMRSAGSPAF